MLSVVMLSVVMLNVVMLSVVMLGVVTPCTELSLSVSFPWLKSTSSSFGCYCFFSFFIEFFLSRCPTRLLTFHANP
jgi:hypothetical protein